MTWDIAGDLNVGQWFAIAGVWVVTLGLSVVVGSWVVPWVLRHASSGDLPWMPWRPPPAPPAVTPQTADPADPGGRMPGASPASGAAGGEGGEPPSGTMSPQAMEVLRGGAWLGVLERLAITSALLAGYPYGIAIVVAIKGLGRYAELREHPVASERFVVGTLASLIWAVGCGLGGLIVIAAIM
ncbi:hypothetical protein [Antribacter gilvus]|uniref:hypothetical protein n=1 Tax=Antribacter gilvus TaxID=2304675 RepID=UPI001F0C13B0|nr:hypothetical protein [Antribacter gilvus]